MFSSFAKENLMQKAGREEKPSVFKSSHNFSVDIGSTHFMNLMF